MKIDTCPECGKRKCGCRPKSPPSTRQREPPVYSDPPADPRYVAELNAALKLRFAGHITQEEMERGFTDAALRSKHVEMAKAHGLWREPKGNQAQEIVKRLAGTFGDIERLGPRGLIARPNPEPEPTGLL